jgi:cholesterol transport system auxiliary component
MTPRIGNRNPGIGALRLVGAAVLAAGLVGGCSVVGGSKAPTTIYAPDPRVPADPAWPQVRWGLEVSRPDAARVVDNLRIAVRPSPGELEVYKGVSWAKTPSEQVEDTVLRTLEDSGRIAAVARRGSGIAADYTLLMDLRRYEADYAGGAVPTATIELSAKLLHAPEQDIVAAHTFVQAVPAAGTGTAQVAQAFEQALATISHDVAGWTLASGEAQERHVAPQAR